MENKTVINPALQQSKPTAINTDIVAEYNRQNGIQDALLSEGTVICDRYVVESQLEVSSGEADLYLCAFDGNKYVAKLYRRKFALKESVIEALLKIDSPYVAKLYETGFYNGFPVEIIPYYKNGSLQGKLFSEVELIETIIPNINEGLKALHSVGVIHKDLKPSNLMLNDDGKTISIIDFGISSAVEGDQTVLITKTGMTPEYSAPETFRNIYYEGSDYYSFGITLFELCCGYTPYANMQQEEIEQYSSLQKIPFPAEMSPMFQDFLSALTYYDITNRKKQNNPNRRWTYNEVKRWLDGDDTLIIPGEGIGNVGKGTMPAFQFLGESYTDEGMLAAALVQNWEEGKKQLFRGYITAHFKLFDTETAQKCAAAEEAAQRENGRDDIIYWNLLHQIAPKEKGFYWKGYVFESLPAFGRDALDRLWSNDYSMFPYYASILSEKLLSQYVKLMAPKNETLKKAAAAIEDSYALEITNGTDMRRTYYLMAYTLSGQKLLFLDGQKFRTVGELAAYMKDTLETSRQNFESLCHRMVDYDGNLDFQLETWLIAIGKQNELEKWRTSMNE